MLSDTDADAGNQALNRAWGFPVELEKELKELRGFVGPWREQ